MKITFALPFADALAAWRRDRALLFPLAGLAMFVPQLAVLLLVPAMPRLAAGDDSETAVRDWTEAVTLWAGQHGIWYLLAPAIGLFAALAVMALYLDPSRPTLGGAMKRAGVLFPRYLLASILVALPIGGLMMPAVASPILLAILLPPIFYLFGRTMLIGPAIVAGAPLGAVAAIGRSWTLTKGNGWVLAGIYGSVMLGAQLVGSLFVSIGSVAGTGARANPVLVAITDGAAAAVAAAAALALALVEVALYRRLARKGM